MSAPAAVLLDADGVLQRTPAGWVDDLRSFAPPGHGTALVEEVFAAERDALLGRRPFPAVLEEVAARHPLTRPLEALLAQWERVEPVAEVWALVGRLRAAGVPCHLASNQHAHRAEAMLRQGYAALLDGCFFSHDLGVLKSSPPFFAEVARRLAVPPGRLLLVDDDERVVATARAGGLRAVRWAAAEPVSRLREALAAEGLPA